ncbi:related to HEM3 - porphobilinogen deaminase [Cephalotrichum gorgonifer]|uniref:hydroxymethylbilane synthase n=1 Tax=Cephalotrichum gorgonifer TaxID=2041049 RepID=A0AAE8N5Y5_9PEZI|nr:related to HEM3 - porphobilinogen deaminase [Cephalotrichum gorgonifer]
MSDTIPAPAARTNIKVGTRDSLLAMKQTHIVIEALQALRPSVTFTACPMKTLGDKDQQTALYKFGGKGLWTNELEAKLATSEIDIIVHSLKDMPTTLPEGFVLACVTPREDARDVVIFKASLGNKYTAIADLPAGSVVGTSSIRRIAQLKRRYPHLEFADVRGNLQTRLAKLDNEAGPFSAIILAAAGMLRLDYGARIAQYLDAESAGVLHAVGQGALGVEARAGDDFVLEMLKEYQHERTMLECFAERSLMRKLEGGCSVPIGVETSWSEGNKLRLNSTVVSLAGTEFADVDEMRVVESVEAAEEFGRDIAVKLVESGAGAILKKITEDGMNLNTA